MTRAMCGGIGIDYTDRGAGEPALLCLSGWCANASAFDRLDLPKRRVLSLDWRGHGKSDASPRDFGHHDLLGDAIAVIEHSRAAAIVPVATAQAGWVAIELRRRFGPTRIPRIVLVDWIVGPAPPPFLEGLAALQDPAHWQAARDGLFAMWCKGVADARVVDFVQREMGAYGQAMWARAGREISAAYRQEKSPLAALSPLAPPTLHLFGPSTAPNAAAVQRAFAQSNPWFVPVELDVQSHFPTIEAPERVSAEIERFLTS